mgnify:CR=1 FL=1
MLSFFRTLAFWIQSDIQIPIALVMKKVLFILGELNDDDIDWAIVTGDRVAVAAGTELIREGQTTDALYLIVDGQFSVSVAAVAHKEIARLSTGEIVGEMSFVDAGPPSATVNAIEDSLVLSIPREKLVQKLEMDLGFASRFYRAIAAFLSHRLRLTVAQLGYSQNLEIITSLDPENGEPIENSALAEARFDWLIRRLRQGQSSDVRDFGDEDLTDGG